MTIFNAKPYVERTVDEYIFRFFYKENSIQNTYLTINTSTNVWSMTLSGGTYSYGFLLEAAKQGLDEQLSGFATYNYLLATQMTQDIALVQDLTDIINKWYERKAQEAAEAAKAISDIQNQVDEVLLQEAVKRGEMTAKQARKASKADRKEMRNILKEDQNNK